MHVRTILRAQKSPSVILSSYDESPHWPPLPQMNISVLYTFQQERELVFVGKGLLSNMQFFFFLHWLFCAYKTRKRHHCQSCTHVMGNLCPPLQLCAPAFPLPERICADPALSRSMKLNLWVFTSAWPFQNWKWNSLWSHTKSSCIENSSELLRK